MNGTPTRAELLEKIRLSRQELEDTLSGLTPEQMGRPVLPGGWSAKDALAHIAAWEGRMLHLIDLAVHNQAPEPGELVFSQEDIDQFNEKTFVQNRDHPLDDVQADFQRSYAQSMQVIAGLPDGELFGPCRHSWLEGQPLWRIVAANTYWHYPEHADEIERRLKGES